VRFESLVPEWKEIRGGMEEFVLNTAQLNNAAADNLRQQIIAESQEEQLAVMASLGIDVRDLAAAEQAILRAKHGVGLQPIHCDIPVYRQAVRCWTTLLYANENYSTAVPTLPIADLRATFTRGDAEPTPDALASLADFNFISVPVKAGTLLVFRTDLPHFGVMNKLRADRILLFSLWGPRSSPPRCYVQRFPLGDDHKQSVHIAYTLTSCVLHVLTLLLCL
jgi:hypothetical protein